MRSLVIDPYIVKLIVKKHQRSPGGKVEMVGGCNLKEKPLAMASFGFLTDLQLVHKTILYCYAIIDRLVVEL